MHIIAAVSRTLPRNAELAQQFELLADLLELDGADAFRLAAYRKAATRIREAAVPVAQLAIEGKATKLSGIGTTIENKIVEYTETGDLSALAKLRDRLPAGLVEVMHVPGLGPKTARKLWTELGVTSADDLRAAAEQGRLSELPGLGKKTEEKVLAALSKPKAKVERRALLGHVLPAVERAVAELRAHPAADRVSEAGSVRRRCETVHDLDIKDDKFRRPETAGIAPILAGIGDAASYIRLDVTDGQDVTVRTRRGAMTAPAKVVTTIRPDTVFVPFHWVGANKLTNDALDPSSRMPEFKVCAAAVAPSRLISAPTEPETRRLDVVEAQR